MKLFEKIKVVKEREIRFLGIPFIQYGKKHFNDTTEKYLKLFPKSFEHKALDNILKFIPKEAKQDHVFIIRTLGLGEANLLNYAIKNLEKKWKFKKPCFVSHRGIYRDMYSLYSDTPFYDLKLPYNEFAPYLLHRNIKYKGKCFHVVHCTAEESGKWLKAHQNGNDSHLIDAIKKWWEIDNFHDNSMKFSQEIIDSTMEKIKNIDLNLDKFIFIAPESNGTKELAVDFWMDLTKKLQEKGYDIFVNTIKENSLYGKSARLSIAEALYLATLSKKLIALRCGFTELLASLDSGYTLYTLYTPFRLIVPESFVKTYSLTKYPFASKGQINELVVDNNESDIIEKILNGIDG